MSLFCLFWIPLFYLFRRNLLSADSSRAEIWALVLGSITAIIRFFAGNFIENGGFGFSRWLSACLDFIALPVFLPFLIYFLFILLRLVPEPFDFSGFVLLWLVPSGAVRSVSWAAMNDPVILIAVPLLWTALAVGVPFFIECIKNNSNPAFVFLFVICITVLPFCAVSSWWAFFSQNYLLAYGLFVVCFVPFLIYLIGLWKTQKAK